MFFVVRISTLTQTPIVHETNTPKGLSKHMFLLRSRVKSILECSFLFHAYIIAYYGARVKHSSACGRRAFSPHS